VEANLMQRITIARDDHTSACFPDPARGAVEQQVLKHLGT
jgi:hypothetical protein